MHNRPLQLRQGNQLPPELDRNRLQIDQALQSRVLSYIQSSPDFERVQTGEMAPSVFIEQVVASSPKELSSAIRVMCAVILGAFVMQSNPVSAQGDQLDGGTIEKDFSAEIADECEKYQEKKLKYEQCTDNAKWKNKEFVLMKIQEDPENIKFVHKSLLKDKKFIISVLNKDFPIALYSEYLDESFMSDRDFVIALIKNDPRFLSEVDDSFKKDREIVLMAVQNHGNALDDADKSFAKDREVVLAAVRSGGTNFCDADHSFRKDVEIALEAIKYDGYAMQYVDESLKNNKEFLIDAMMQNGYAIQYIPESFKTDRDIVLAAVKQNGGCLKHLNEIFKKDKEVVLAAVMNNGSALYHADESFRGDREVVLAAVTQNGEVLEYADESLRKDKEIVLAAVRQKGWVLKFANKSFKKDREVVLIAVKSCREALYHADESFKKDKGIVLEAIKSDKESFGYADKSLKHDVDLLSALFDDEPYYDFEKLSKELKELNIDFPERFHSLNVLEEIIKNRRNINRKDDRLVSVNVFNKSDWNNAFADNQLEELIEHGYNVLYFEAETDIELLRALKSSTIDVGRKADLLTIEGHGSPYGVILGNGYSNEEKYYLDIYDDPKISKLKNALNKKSTVIISACSTGAGGRKRFNFANVIKKAFTQSLVFASKVDGPVLYYRYDFDNRVIGAEYPETYAQTHRW